MARMNLEKMSLKELQELEGELTAVMAQKKVTEREAMKAEIAAMAAKSGFSVQELFGKGAGRKGSTVAPKYRNPDNTSETWAGRGRPPRWLSAFMKKGVKREKFLIK